MTRIDINAGGRQVTIEADGELTDVMKTALDAWRATDGAEWVRFEGGTGFQAERADGPTYEHDAAGTVRSRP